MTPGETYCTGMLVRVVGPDFVAGVIFDREGRAVITAPILAYLRGQHADQLRRTFKRLGWRATIVRCAPGGVVAGDDLGVRRMSLFATSKEAAKRDTG